MPKTKYKKEYAEKLVAYFLKFLELRDDPANWKKAEQEERILADELGNLTKDLPPCSGYPTLNKFAIKIGVTPRTITNWREKYPAFAEACEFADAIQDDILNERALTGAVDGRVAMKIRELKQNAKKAGAESDGGGVRLTINVGADDQDQQIEIQRWTGPVNEDTDY